MRDMKLILMIPVLALASCSSLTPAEQAVAKRLEDKALAVGESKLDAWLGLPPAAAVVPNAAPVGATPVAVKASGK